MGAEKAENSEKKDPVVERAEAALSRIETRRSDRVEDLAKDKTALETTQTELRAEQVTAQEAGTSKGNARYLALGKTIDRLDVRIREIKDKMEKVENHAERRREGVLDNVSEKASQLETKAARIELHDTPADVRATRLLVLRDEVARYKIIIDDPDTTKEARDAAVKSQGEALAEIERNDQVDRSDATLKRSREVREFQESEEAKDKLKAEESLALGLADPSIPGTAKPEAKQESGSFGDRMSAAAEGLAKDLALNPPDKDSLADKLGLAWKKSLLHVTLWISPKTVDWESNFDEGQKQILKKTIGMTFKPTSDGRTDRSLIEWVAPEEGYDAPNSGTQHVMQDYFGNDWFKQLDTLKPKTDTEPGTTLSELQGKVLDPPKNDEDSQFKQFVEELASKGAKPEDNVLSWLEKNSHLMRKEETETPKQKETPQDSPLKIDTSANTLVNKAEVAPPESTVTPEVSSTPVPEPTPAAPTPAPEPTPAEEPVASGEQKEKTEIQSPVLSAESIKLLSNFPGLLDPKVSLETTEWGDVTRVNFDPTQLSVKVDGQDLKEGRALDITHFDTITTDVNIKGGVLTLTIYNTDDTTRTAILSPKGKA